LARASAIPSRAINNMRFYSKNPVSAAPESFNQRAAQIQQMVRQNPLGASNYSARPGVSSAPRFGSAGGAAGGVGSVNRPGYVNPRPMAPSTQGQSGNTGWQRFASRSPYSSPAQGGQSPRSYSSSSPYSTTRPQTRPGGQSVQPRPAAPQQGSYQGGWQRFSRQNQPAPSTRSGAWNAPAQRFQSSAPSWGGFSSRPGPQSYSGYGSRPSLNIRRPIVVARPTAPRSYGGGGYSAPSGGGRGYSAPSGGGHGNFAPSGGGGHSAPAPSHGGGGGGGGHGRR